MTAGPVAARAGAASIAARAGLLGVGALVVLIVVIVAGIVSWPSRSLMPSAATQLTVAIADIPADYLALYQQAAAAYGIDWAVLAAIGKLECDHGRLRAPGCSPPGTVNAAGATGP